MSITGAVINFNLLVIECVQACSLTCGLKCMLLEVVLLALKTRGNYVRIVASSYQKAFVL